MINSVTLKNFRGLTELTVPLSSVTMMTGVNGVGKTSVLEGLYCLFSQTRLDVSPLSRYNKSLGININQNINQAANAPVGFSVKQSYNYRLFWEECPSFGNYECSVEARTDSLNWSWTYNKAKLSDLNKQITENNPFQVDASSEFALFNWSTQGIAIHTKLRSYNEINVNLQRAQLISQDGGLYLLPIVSKFASVCYYFDFASIRVQPQKLSFQTAKKLTSALNIINPNLKITDVRLSDIESGLSVIIDNKYEVSLSTIGNGAVTWASTLITIFDYVDFIEQHPEMPALILVDEMGAGIHYSIMLEVWEFFSKFHKQNNNIQFVFTSHSDDCIKAFCEAFLSQDDASIIRLHQTSVGKKIIPTEYKKESFQNIIDEEWEVRG